MRYFKSSAIKAFLCEKKWKKQSLMTIAVFAFAMIVIVQLFIITAESGRAKSFTFSVGSAEYYIDSEAFKLPSEVYMDGDTIYIPAEPVLKQCGYVLGWDSDTGAVIFSDDKDNSYLYPESDTVFYKGENISFDAPTEIYNGMIYMTEDMFSRLCGKSIIIK